MSAAIARKAGPIAALGLQGGFFGHKRFYGAVHVVSMGWFMTL